MSELSESKTSDDKTIECPFCAERISPKAKKCKHCREILDPTLRRAEEALRASDKHAPVYMNAGGAAVAGGASGLRPFPHMGHIIFTLITMGAWLPFWILIYLFRNKAVYF